MKCMVERLLETLVLGLCLGTAATASGGITNFATMNDWSAAFPNNIEDPFPTFPVGHPDYEFPLSGGTFDTDWLRILVPANHGEVMMSRAGVFWGDVHRPGQGDPQWNRFEFKTPVKAVAFSLLGMEQNEPLSVVVLGQTFLVYPQPQPPPLRSLIGFFGVSSTESFQSVEIRHPGVINNNEFYSVSTISFQPVPEPSLGVVLFAVALAHCCGFFRRAADCVP
jgi:hypothetical protein